VEILETIWISGKLGSRRCSAFEILIAHALELPNPSFEALACMRSSPYNRQYTCDNSLSLYDSEGYSHRR
jgi:hypothetical protein